MKSTEHAYLIVQCELELIAANRLKRNRHAIDSLNLIPLLEQLNHFEADNRQSDAIRDQIRWLILRFSEYLPEWHPQSRNEKRAAR